MEVSSQLVPMIKALLNMLCDMKCLANMAVKECHYYTLGSRYS